MKIINRIIVVLIVVLGVGCLSYTLQAVSPATIAPYTAIPPRHPSSLLKEINTIRSTVGKKPLVEDSRLDKSATIKAQDMAENHYFNHDRPDGQDFSVLLFKYSPDAEMVGENLAKCYKTTDDAVKAWVNSPKHYANIIGNWRFWGAGSATSDCVYLVNHFSR